MKKLIIAMIIAISALTSAQAEMKTAEEVYNTYCFFCHTKNGGQDLGPDFNMISYKRTKAEVKAYVENPEDLSQAYGYSGSGMPTFQLTENELELISDYIDKLQPFKEWMKN